MHLLPSPCLLLLMCVCILNIYTWNSPGCVACCALNKTCSLYTFTFHQCSYNNLTIFICVCKMGSDCKVQSGSHTPSSRLVWKPWFACTCNHPLACSPPCWPKRHATKPLIFFTGQFFTVVLLNSHVAPSIILDPHTPRNILMFRRYLMWMYRTARITWFLPEAGWVWRYEQQSFQGSAFCWYKVTNSGTKRNLVVCIWYNLCVCGCVF